MRLVKKLLNRTETYVILIALLFGVAVEAVSHQFFSNTGMVNLARISMIYLIFGVAEMISLVCAGPDVSYPAIASLSAFLAASLLGVWRPNSVFFSASSTVSSRLISCRTADTPNRKFSI